MIDRRRGLMGVNGNYEDLKYLQSNGHQYIDLNYAPNNNSGFYIDFITVSYVDDVVLGCRSSNGQKWWINSYGSGAYVFWATSTVDVFSPLTNRGLRIELNYLNSRELKSRVTGYTKAISGELTQFETNACLFAGRNTSGVGFHAKIKCSEVEITEGNAVLMHLLPKLRKSDGKPGMYDTLRNVFLVNNGSGEFGYEKLDGTIVAPI